MELDMRQIIAALVLTVFSFTSYIYYDMFVMKLKQFVDPSVGVLQWVLENPILTSIVLGGITTIVIVSLFLSFSGGTEDLATKE